MRRRTECTSMVFLGSAKSSYSALGCDGWIEAHWTGQRCWMRWHGTAKMSVLEVYVRMLVDPTSGNASSYTLL